MALAVWTDCAVALGRPASSFSGEQQAQLDHWLDGIELLIGARLGDVAELDAAVVKYVETEAAAAKFRRSQGDSATSVTVAVDDGSVTRRYESSVSASDIADAWWNLLDPSIGSGVFSTRPYFEPDETQWAVGTPPSPYLDPAWRTL